MVELLRGQEVSDTADFRTHLPVKASTTSTRRGGVVSLLVPSGGVGNEKRKGLFADLGWL